MCVPSGRWCLARLGTQRGCWHTATLCILRRRSRSAARLGQAKAGGAAALRPRHSQGVDEHMSFAGGSVTALTCRPMRARFLARLAKVVRGTGEGLRGVTDRASTQLEADERYGVVCAIHMCTRCMINSFGAC